MHLYLAFLLHRDYFAPAGCISIWLFCSTEIIPPRPDASLSGSFAPQGLFPPVRCISIWLFCSTGIILTNRMHLYLAFLLHRDYFDRPDASLSGSFAPQGLFRPVRCISILLFCSTGIISAGRMHLYLALLLHRDYFGRPVASLSDSFAPQGLFRPGRMHLYLALLFHRDYFTPVGCISILLFCSTRIISPGQMHLYLALLFHRDYFHRSDASLSGSFAPQGLFPPARCISILLFCSTGIISTGRMHLYLTLLFHRDYFHQSDASLSGSFVPQGLFPPVRCISVLLFCSTGIISTCQIEVLPEFLIFFQLLHFYFPSS